MPDGTIFRICQVYWCERREVPICAEKIVLFSVVDAQKWFASMVSSLFHTNSSHFLILLTLISWKNWSYFIICILFHINSKPFQINSKPFQINSESPQINSKSVLINPKHIKNPKSIIIWQILGIVVAFSVLETYQPINLINLTLVLSQLSMLGQTIILVIWSLTSLSLSMSNHGIIMAL